MRTASATLATLETKGHPLIALHVQQGHGKRLAVSSHVPSVRQESSAVLSLQSQGQLAASAHATQIRRPEALYVSIARVTRASRTLPVRIARGASQEHSSQNKGLRIAVFVARANFLEGPGKSMRARASCVHGARYRSSSAQPATTHVCPAQLAHTCHQQGLQRVYSVPTRQSLYRGHIL